MTDRQTPEQRIAELEAQLLRAKNRTVEARGKNARLRSRINELETENKAWLFTARLLEDRLTTVLNERDVADERAERLKTALEKYAYFEHWSDCTDCNGGEHHAAMWALVGPGYRIARTALAELAAQAPKGREPDRMERIVQAALQFKAIDDLNRQFCPTAGTVMILREYLADAIQHLLAVIDGDTTPHPNCAECSGDRGEANVIECEYACPKRPKEGQG